MEANYTQNSSSIFKIFTRRQIRRIHYATLEILERTGVKIESETALELLDRTQVNQEAGADDTASSEEMLRQKTIDIMENHQPPAIADDVMKEVRSLEKSWFEKLDLKYDYRE